MRLGVDYFFEEWRGSGRRRGKEMEGDLPPTKKKDREREDP